MVLADKVVALHVCQVEELSRSGFPGEKFYVVSQPVKIPPDLKKRDVRKAFSIPASADLVLHVGRLDRDKNLALLKETVGYVLKHSGEVHFLIVGGGSMADALRGQLDSPNVHFVGAIERAELPAYYQAADVFLTASLSEGLSNVIAEALYHGLPVVSADSGCITRSLVSNIGNNPQELGEMLLSGNLQRDVLPCEMRGPENARLWKNLIGELLKKRHGS
jgi:glycosyltransferase involved in cell wall biosynthesis